ncbi:hypothetical protein DO66_6105 [Burkholderia pseudomallei]|nr:hypothetical protein DO66_6105 [Burkholderia pseudomallei]
MFGTAWDAALARCVSLGEAVLSRGGVRVRRQWRPTFSPHGRRER